MARDVKLATVCLARNQKHTFIESGWRGVVSIYADSAHDYCMHAEEACHTYDAS